MDAKENKQTGNFSTPPVHSTETGRQYVRPIDILRSEKGREQIRLLRQAKLVEPLPNKDQAKP
jgi:hypothetical protein